MRKTKLLSQWIKDHAQYYRDMFLGWLFPKKLADILYVRFMGGVKLTGIILPISMKKLIG